LEQTENLASPAFYELQSDVGPWIMLGAAALLSGQVGVKKKS
jgi:hypothetical protein